MNRKDAEAQGNSTKLQYFINGIAACLPAKAGLRIKER